MDEPVSITEDQPVDPELKAHITNLVSALGGPDITQEGRPYILGDEALACLRDLKTWIKAYDERMNRWDVARAMSETSLVTFDLLEILTKWEKECQAGENTKMDDRIALACLELLVPLTWPLLLQKGESTNNHYRHAPYLEQSRIRYKKAILQHPQKKVLRAVVRLSVPVLKMAKSDRTARDESVVKLVLYLFRNLLAIEPPSSTEKQRVEDDISRSNTLTAFDNQDVVAFIVTIAAQIGSQFSLQDTAVLECVFHMLKGLKPKDLFVVPGAPADQEAKKGPTDLKGVLQEEKKLKQVARKGGPQRHSRFGTMVSMVTENGTRYAVSGQDGLASTEKTLSKLDGNKKWTKPGKKKREQGEFWNQEVPLSTESRTIVENFSQDFLDSGFNPVIGSIRKLIETDNERLTTENQLQFLYLVGFCLECERLKRQVQRATGQPESDYGLVAEALNQNMFIVVMRLMRTCHERGPQQNLRVVYATMVCFVEVLRIVRQMDTSDDDQDQEVAENMQQRLFYEEHSLQVLATMPRIAINQSQQFLTKAIELTEVVLKMLEAFSQQHTEHFVKTKRQRKQRLSKPQEDDGYGGDDAEESRRVTNERRFDFNRFEQKYVSIETLNSYKRYLSSYREMSSSEIKSGLWFIHRLFRKKDLRVWFYSLDMMRLLQKMCDSSDGVPKHFKVRRDVDRFMSYYVDKLRQALESTPALYVELLFDKLPEHVFYLTYGYEQVKTTKHRELAAVWEFKEGELTEEQKHGVLVAALIDEDKRELVEWVIDQMTTFKNNREDPQKSAVDEVLDGDEDKIRSTKRDGKFRLLLQLLGFNVPKVNTDHCVLPQSYSPNDIETGLKYLKKYMFEQFQIDQNPGAAAADYLERQGAAERAEKARQRKEQQKAKRQQRKKDGGEGEDDDNHHGYGDADGMIVSDDDPIEHSSSDGDGEATFKRKRSSKKRKSKSKSDKKSTKPGGKNAKEEQPLPIVEETRRYKSADFIDSADDMSDEERDAEFFASEAQLRQEIMGKMNQSMQRIPNKAEADKLFDRLHKEWTRPQDDDKVVGDGTNANASEGDGDGDGDGDEDSLFVGGDGDAGSNAHQQSQSQSQDKMDLDNESENDADEDEDEDEDDDGPKKRVKRVIADDDDDE